jgi:hypothetical protein
MLSPSHMWTQKDAVSDNLLSSSFYVDYTTIYKVQEPSNSSQELAALHMCINVYIYINMYIDDCILYDSDSNDQTSEICCENLEDNLYMDMKSTDTATYSDLEELHILAYNAM